MDKVKERADVPYAEIAHLDISFEGIGNELAKLQERLMVTRARVENARNNLKSVMSRFEELAK